jgi:hypothetical protein
MVGYYHQEVIEMDLFIAVLGLVVSIIGLDFGYVSYENTKNTDC